MPSRRKPLVQSLLPAAGTPAIFDKTTIIRSTSILTTTVKLTSSTGLANSTISRTSSTRSSSSRTASATSVTSPTSIPGITADQQNAVNLHNEARKLVGCSPLTWDAGLANDAQVYAKTLASIDKLQHDANRGNEGENLAAAASRMLLLPPGGSTRSNTTPGRLSLWLARTESSSQTMVTTLNVSGRLPPRLEWRLRSLPRVRPMWSLATHQLATSLAKSPTSAEGEIVGP
uniref:Scp-like extracellular n=1 Tax=Colletotrichum fructicola (strain Nara gc5) TaxID=1213859 RepID=L2GC67_COLFN